MNIVRNQLKIFFNLFNIDLSGINSDIADNFLNRPDNIYNLYRQVLVFFQGIKIENICSKILISEIKE